MREFQDADFSRRDAAGLTAPEIAQLRALLQVVRFDPHERAFVVDTGAARLTVRADGTVRIDAAKIVQVAEGTLTLDAGRIDLN